MPGHLRQRAGVAAFRHFAFQRFRQQAAHGLPQPHRGREQRRHHGLAQQGALRPVAPGTRHALVHDLAADVHQVPVLDARGARGFAIAAGQAAVQMLLSGLRGLGALQHLLDEVDASARAVQFIAQHLIGRTGGRAEAAVHATPEDGVGLVAQIGIACPGCQLGLHDAL
ncbi:hypothetical protein D9M69_626590 [compost metagenome]